MKIIILPLKSHKRGKEVFRKPLTLRALYCEDDTKYFTTVSIIVKAVIL